MHYKLPEKASKPLLIKGDAFEEIKLFKGNTFDSIIIDFPYLIGFMNMKWDQKSAKLFDAYQQFFKDCIRVLKPGGRMLAFTGSTNYDLFVGWGRKAGFLIQSMMSWVYSSGMPHGIDVVKYSIKQFWLPETDAWEVIRFNFRKEDDFFYEINLKNPYTNEVDYVAGHVPEMFRKYCSSKRSNKTSKDLLLSKLRYLHAEYFGYSVISYDFIRNKESENETGFDYRALFRNRARHEIVKTGPATQLMLDYDGYNSGMKPALEPIAHFQKPLDEDTIVANVIKWGVGALNIKDCKIPLEGMDGVDVEQLIVQMKVNMGLLPPEALETQQDVDMKLLVGDISNMSQSRGGKKLNGTEVREGTDHTFGGSSIPDRLNSGGGGSEIELGKALKDIKSQLFGSNKATEGTTFKDTTISDRLNSGGGGNNKNMKKMINNPDFHKQIRGNHRRVKNVSNALDNNIVHEGSGGDSLNAGGRAFVDPNFDKMVNTYKKYKKGWDI